MLNCTTMSAQGHNAGLFCPSQAAFDPSKFIDKTKIFKRQLCPAGFYCPNSTVRRPCPPGKYCWNGIKMEGAVCPATTTCKARTATRPIGLLEMIALASAFVVGLALWFGLKRVADTFLAEQRERAIERGIRDVKRVLGNSPSTRVLSPTNAVSGHASVKLQSTIRCVGVRHKTG